MIQCGPLPFSPLNPQSPPQAPPRRNVRFRRRPLVWMALDWNVGRHNEEEYKRKIVSRPNDRPLSDKTDISREHLHALKTLLTKWQNVASIPRTTFSRR